MTRLDDDGPGTDERGHLEVVVLEYSNGEATCAAYEMAIPTFTAPVPLVFAGTLQAGVRAVGGGTASFDYYDVVSAPH